MKVTAVRVDRLKDPQSAVLGYADIKLDDVLEINHIRIVEGRNGVFAAMPSWRRGDGTWCDFVIPRDPDLHQEISTLILAAFEEAE